MGHRSYLLWLMTHYYFLEENMSKQIAIVALGPGKVGFYDPLTRIHLTLSNPRANITDDMNLKQIRKSIASGTLKVVYGNLPPVKKAEQSVVKTIKKLTPKTPVEEEALAEVKEEVVIPTEEVTAAPENDQPVVDVPAEETPVEEAPKKRGRKKSEVETNENAETEVEVEATSEVVEDAE